MAKLVTSQGSGFRGQRLGTGRFAAAASGEAALHMGLRAKAAPRGRRAFTLAELLVSVAILSLLLITVGAIFAMSTKATTLANANNEVLNSLRALEQQIRQDFRGIRRDAFVGLCYNWLANPNDTVHAAHLVAPGRPERAFVRSDAVVFFANGDFQTMGQGQWWDPVAQTLGSANAVPVKGNLARIEYGMLGVFDNGVAGNGNAARPLSQIELGRFAKLMISDLAPTVATEDPPRTSDMTAFLSFQDTSGSRWDKTTDVYENWEYEYVTQADWCNPFVWPGISLVNATMDPSYFTRLVGYYPGTGNRNNLWLGLPYIDVAQTLADHLRMIPGCVSFKIQRWAEQDPVNPLNAWVPRWWPEDNEAAAAMNTVPPLPAGSSGFGPDIANLATVTTWPGLRIWECFNVPGALPQSAAAGYTGNDWPQALNSAVGADPMTSWLWVSRSVPAVNALQRAVPADFPKALKITISVLDAKRRAMDKVPASNRVYTNHELQAIGAQTFTMVIPLE